MKHHHLYNKIVKGLTIVFGISLTLLAHAQPDNSPDNLSQCVSVEDILARVACYDAVSGRSNTNLADESIVEEASIPPNSSDQQLNVSTVVESDIEKTQATITTEEQFGLRLEIKKNAQDEIITTIKEVKQTEPFKWLITLGNGQVWKQVIGKRFSLNQDDEIRIYASRWGSQYRLSLVNGSGYIQVKRLR